MTMAAWQKARESPADAEQRADTRRLIFDRINALEAQPPSSQRDAELRVWEEVRENLNLQRTVDKLNGRVAAQSRHIRVLQAALNRRNATIRTLQFQVAEARQARP